MAGKRAQARTAASGVIGEMTLDADAFMADLVRAVAKIHVASEAALWVLGLRIQNTARLLVPVDTGRLRSSIQAHKGDRVVEIVAGTEYAALVEFGTVSSPAQPYMRPALAEAAGMWTVTVKEAA